jgi:hypothetical protein
MVTAIMNFQSQNLTEFLKFREDALQSTTYEISNRAHVSSEQNRLFNSLEEFTHLDLASFDPALIPKVIQFFTQYPLPPLVSGPFTQISNETVATEICYREVVYGVKSIVNLIYPYLSLYLLSQYAKFVKVIDDSIKSFGESKIPGKHQCCRIHRIEETW